MSVHREDRWQAEAFTRKLGDFSMHVDREIEEPLDGGERQWDWVVFRDGCIEGQGVKPDEKAAKLAARRCVERVLMSETKEGK